MAKPSDLRDAMLNKARPAAVSPEPATVAAPSPRRPGRQGKSNVTGYFAPPVKRQLRRLAADSDRTIQSLIGEALNDLFAKHGLPEIADTE